VRAPASVHTLVWRQIRVPTAVMTALVVLVLRVGISSFSLSGGERGMIALRPVIENPAVSALYGRVTSLTSAGAFVEWKMGMFIALAIAMWAALMATRVTRGSEDDGTWDLLVVSRVGRQPALARAMFVLLEAGLVVGAATFLTLLSGGQRAPDSVLYGLAMTGIAWSGVALGLLGSQFFAPRRSASQVALCSIGLLFIVRVLADGSSGNVWLRWLTPFGWLENVGAFHHLVTVWFVPLLVLPAGTAIAAWRFQRSRDVGAAWWTRADRSRPRESLLRTPWRFAWRERWGMLGAWTLGLGVLGLVVGYLTNALVQLCRTDPGYVRLLKRWGFGSMVTGRGFIAEACVLFAVAISFMVAALLVSIGTDSFQGRLDLPLSYGTSRTKWLASGGDGSDLDVLCAGDLGRCRRERHDDGTAGTSRGDGQRPDDGAVADWRQRAAHRVDAQVLVPRDRDVADRVLPRRGARASHALARVAARRVTVLSLALGANSAVELGRDTLALAHRGGGGSARSSRVHAS